MPTLTSPVQILERLAQAAETRHPVIAVIRLSDADFCPDCRIIFTRGGACPECAGDSLMLLQPILDRVQTPVPQYQGGLRITEAKPWPIRTVGEEITHIFSVENVMDISTKCARNAMAVLNSDAAPVGAR